MKIGILCAIPKEIIFFDLKSNSARMLGGRMFFTKREENHELTLVESGLGKVNAALVSTLLIHEFGCELLIFSGVAGGIDPEIKIGEVVIGDSLIQYDYGALNEGQFQVYRAGSIPMGPSNHSVEFKLDPEIKKIIKAVLPRVRMGTILTGDLFLQCGEKRRALFEQFGAQAIEMEGGGVAQVVEQFGIPAIVVRCISDLAGANGQKLSYEFLNTAAKKSYETVQTLLKALL